MSKVESQGVTYAFVRGSLKASLSTLNFTTDGFWQRLGERETIERITVCVKMADPITHPDPIQHA